LINYINHQALSYAYPDPNKYLEFIQKLKKYYFVRNEIYSEIEKKLPKNRKHLLYNDI